MPEQAARVAPKEFIARSSGALEGEKPERPLSLIAAVADDLPFGIWVARAPGGEFLYANRRFTEIMGMGARDDVKVGEYSEPYGIRDLAGNAYPEDRLPFVRALKARGPVEVDDIVIHRYDGRRVNIRALARPMWAADGSMEAIVIAFSDITREVHAEINAAESEARLHHAEKMEAVARLSGGVVHDFNNLLVSVKMLTATLRRDEKDPGKRAHLDRIDHAAQSAMDLTGALLGFARGGRRQPMRMSLHGAIEAIADLVRRTGGPKSDVRLSLDSTRSELVADPTRVEQMLLNLALNARDAMPGGGVTSFRTADLPDGRILLEVADQGRGIAPELREKVFEPYFTTKPAGTGIGLWVVREVVGELKGEITIADAEPHGTRFEIRLPAAPLAKPR